MSSGDTGPDRGSRLRAMGRALGGTRITNTILKAAARTDGSMGRSPGISQAAAEIDPTSMASGDDTESGERGLKGGLDHRDLRRLTNRGPYRPARGGSPAGPRA